MWHTNPVTLSEYLSSRSLLSSKILLSQLVAARPNISQFKIMKTCRQRVLKRFKTTNRRVFNLATWANVGLVYMRKKTRFNWANYGRVISNGSKIWVSRGYVVCSGKPSFTAQNVAVILCRSWIWAINGTLFSPCKRGHFRHWWKSVPFQRKLFGIWWFKLAHAFLYTHPFFFSLLFFFLSCLPLCSMCSFSGASAFVYYTYT